MAEAKPVQPSADRSAMDAHAMHRSHLGHDLVQREVAFDPQPIPEPAVEAGQLALDMVALRLWQKTAALAFQNDHVVHEAR